MYLFDIFPTACELADLKDPTNIEGRSVVPVIRGEKSTHRETIFLSYEKGQRAVRKGDWKLYRFPLVNYSMLFNLAEDPHELKNLAESPEYQSRVKEMMDLLAKEQAKWNDPNPHTSDNPKPAKIEDPSFFTKPENQVQSGRGAKRQGEK